MGLRTRLLLVIVIGLGLSLAATLALLLRLERHEQARGAAERAEALLQTLAVPVAQLLTQGHPADLEHLLAALHSRKDALDLDRIVLVDGRGRVLADSEAERYGMDLAAADAFVARAVTTDGALVEREGEWPARVAVAVQNGTRWATLVGTVSAQALRERVSARRRRLILSAVAVSGLGLVLLLLVLSTTVVTPMRELARAAHRFADGDLQHRAPVDGAEEIAVLGGALNTAAERLSRHTTELEAEVKRRTEELQEKNAALKEANARLERLAITDGLTGLHNHRHFQSLLAMEVTRQRRTRRAFSLLLFDVDHFKHYNDAHGHPAGDEVLRDVARLLRENVRAGDVVARYGGEEFVVLLYDTPLEAAQGTAEKLRATIAEHRFPHAQAQPLGRVSLSVGVATWPEHAEGALDLVEAADRALYRAKAAGRDRVRVAVPLGGVV